jgi:hypothetical protein
MAFSKAILVFTLGFMFALDGCVPQSMTPNPAKIVDTVTPIHSKAATFTPHPTFTTTVIPTSFVTPTLIPEPTSAAVWWFPIPEIPHSEVMVSSTAQLFQGIKIPPWPGGLIKEFNTGQDYGEVPSSTVFYHLFLVRKGNARMLWLGIPFKEANWCCGQETSYRIYDSIPFPPVEKDNLLIPFVCRRNNEFDIFMIVVAESPQFGESATNIRYAWRIDQETISLKPVSIQGIECRSDYY